MARDPQIVTTTQHHILWAAGAGVLMLTAAYLLGVQVGKQGVAMRKPLPANSDEDLKDLPEPLVDQLQLLEGDQNQPPKLVPAQPATEAPKPEPKPESKPETQADAKPQAKTEAKHEAKAASKPGPWTLQLVTTKDPEEAKRVAKKVEAAGFKTSTVKEKGLLKVRLQNHSDRPTVDTAAEQLKKAGFKPFAVKVD